MASTVNDRFELIEPLPVPPGDIAKAAYKARETVSSVATEEVPAGRVVVLRLLPREAVSPSLASASEVAAKLKGHPNILAHYGLTEIAAQEDIEPGLYIVSEYARGLTLRERIRRVAPFSLAVALDIATAVTKALVYTYDRGIAHGDLRPEQVLLTPEGQVRVADFAISRAAHEAMGDASEAYADDTRAVGLLLYEMLTGVAPEQMGVTGEQSPRQINAGVPPAIDSIVLKATSLDPKRRYGSPSALLADLQTAREDLRVGKPLTWTVLAAKPSRAVVPQASPGALTQAAEELAAQRASESAPAGKPSAQPAEWEDDADARDAGSPVLSRVIMTLLIGLVIIVVAACAYFTTMLSVPTDVVVPNLIGKQFTDAQQEVSHDHLNLVQTGEDYSDTWPAGTIYQTSPPAGRTIKSGKDIDVSVSEGPRLTDVPDLSQMTLDKAKQILGSLGLPLGTTSTDYSDLYAKGLVISQQPTAGSKVAHNTAVDITVSKGPSPPETPTGLSASSTIEGEIDLSWDPVADATAYDVYRDGKRIAAGEPQTAYSDLNLSDGETHSYAVTAVDANGESAQSQPVSATTTAPQSPAGSTVPPPPQVSTPPSTAAPSSDSGALRQRSFHIRFRVPDQAAGTHNVQIEVQDATGTNVFYDEDRAPGDTVDENITAFGNKVIFRIFIDGRLIKQQVK